MVSIFQATHPRAELLTSPTCTGFFFVFYCFEPGRAVFNELVCMGGGETFSLKAVLFPPHHGGFRFFYKYKENSWAFWKIKFLGFFFILEKPLLNLILCLFRSPPFSINFSFPPPLFSEKKKKNLRN